MSIALLLTLSIKVYADARYGGISTRCLVKPSDKDQMIAGFLITGGSKEVKITASTVTAGIANNGFIPQFEVKTFPNAELVYADNNASAAQRISTNLTLSEGLYTVTVKPTGQEGVGLIEVYETGQTDASLSSISTRCYVGVAAEDAMMAGVIVSGGSQCTELSGVGFSSNQIPGNAFLPKLDLNDLRELPLSKIIYTDSNAKKANAITQYQMLDEGVYTTNISPVSQGGIGQVVVSAMDLANCGNITNNDNTDPTNPIIPSSSKCGVVTTTCPDLNLLPISKNIQPSIGIGIESGRQAVRSTPCIDGIVKPIDGGTSEFSINAFTSYSDILRISQKSGGGKVTLGSFSIGGGVAESKYYRKTKYEQLFTMNYSVLLGRQKFFPNTDDLFTNAAKPYINDSCRLKQYCGDSFVEQVELGAQLYVKMNFKFSSEIYRKQFSAVAGLSISTALKNSQCDPCTGLTSVTSIPVTADIAGAIGKLSRTVKQSGTMEVTAVQEGGNVEDLASAIGSTFSSCSLADVKACTGLMDKVIDYAATKFADSVRTSPPKVLSYATNSLATIPGVAAMPSEATPEIIQARQELADSYEKSLKALDKVGNLLQYNLEPQRQQKMEQLQTALMLDIENISAAAEVCFSDLSQCLVQKCAVMDSLATGYTLEELELGYSRDDALLLYLGFDFNVEDYSWHHNHGIINGNLTYSPDGISGAAANFDGNTFVVIPNTESFKFSNSSFTFSTWVNISPNENGVYRGFISLSNPSGEPRLDLAKAKNTSKVYGGRAYMQTFNGGTEAIPLGYVLPKDKWVYLVGVVDQEQSLVTFYIDGMKQNSSPTVPFNLPSPKLVIASCTFCYPHIGLMDEVRIWERALSEKEIVELYNEGKNN